MSTLLLLLAACTAGRQAGSGSPAIQAHGHVAKIDSVSRHALADSLFMEAQRNKMAGDLKLAIGNLESSDRLVPGNAAVYYELSYLFSQLHHNQEALSYARQAYLSDSSNRWMAMAFADALAQQGQPDSAAAIYGQLRRQYPFQDEYLLSEAALLYAAEHYQQAMGLLDELESRRGLSEELVYQKQLIYLKLHKVDSAAAEIRKLISRDPSESRYYGLLAEVYESNDMTDQAMAVYDTLLKRNPDNPQALVALALYYKKDHDDAQYRQYMQRAFANPAYNIEDKIAFAYPFLKYVEVDSTKKDEALFLCRMIVQSHPEDARAYALYGDMLYQCKEPDSALQVYRHALSLNADRFEIWQQVMLIYASQEQNDSLLGVCDTVTKRFPDQMLGWYFQGMVKVLEHQYEGAISSLRRALEIGVKGREMKSRIYASLGEAYHETGNDTASDSCFNVSLQINPDDDVTLNNYSFYLSERGTQLDKAERMCKTALALKPGYYVYEDTYAWVLYKMRKYKQARLWIEKALQDPEARENPGYLEHYGDILYRLNEVDMAVKYWQMARDKGGDSPYLYRKIENRRLGRTSVSSFPAADGSHG